MDDPSDQLSRRVTKILCSTLRVGECQDKIFSPAEKQSSLPTPSASSLSFPFLPAGIGQRRRPTFWLLFFSINIMKYILVSGGVISGIGKGITASSTGLLLKTLGLKVTAIKIDPYINVDAGTMAPTEYVTGVLQWDSDCY